MRFRAWVLVPLQGAAAVCVWKLECAGCHCRLLLQCCCCEMSMAMAVLALELGCWRRCRVPVLEGAVAARKNLLLFGVYAGVIFVGKVNPHRYQTIMAIICVRISWLLARASSSPRVERTWGMPRYLGYQITVNVTWKDLVQVSSRSAAASVCAKLVQVHAESKPSCNGLRCLQV